MAHIVVSGYLQDTPALKSRDVTSDGPVAQAHLRVNDRQEKADGSRDVGDEIYVLNVYGEDAEAVLNLPPRTALLVAGSYWVDAEGVGEAKRHVHRIDVADLGVTFAGQQVAVQPAAGSV